MNFKSFLNPYEPKYKVNGMKMDLFGKLSYELTDFKEKNIFKYDFKTRCFGVFLPVMLLLKFPLRLKHKLFLSVFTYHLTAVILAPELINPYYNCFFYRNEKSKKLEFSN